MKAQEKYLYLMNHQIARPVLMDVLSEMMRTIENADDATDERDFAADIAQYLKASYP